MNNDLATWALPRLQRLLPIDDESLREILTYTTTLSKEAGAEHLKNILGENAQSFDFISGFNSRRGEVREPITNASQSALQQGDESVPRKKKTTKNKPPLHSAGPVRRPEGYGDTTGAYQKPTFDNKNLASNLALTSAPPSAASNSSHSTTPRRASPNPTPSIPGHLISDLPNIRTKTTKSRGQHASNPPSNNASGTSTPRHSHTATTSSIADLTTAISNLELLTNPTLANTPRKCPCNASLHPLFTTAPNCLHCGKIICALEGLQPCSFCNSPILSPAQINEMITALKQERGAERQATHNAGVHAASSGRGTPVFANSPQPGSAESSGDEGGAAARARAHRDKLLSFQRENAQRTRVHDEAADFEVTQGKGMMWMTPVQRAAALKRQQGYLRELQEASRPEWERKKTVMSMSVKGGKLVRTYERVPVSSSTGDVTVDDEDVEDHLGDEGGVAGDSRGVGTFSNNPLMKGGGLIRPVWKPKGIDGKGKDAERTKERQSVWRRVQDDNEDNEKWILDGGLRGYGVETRLMEDGSQQECG